MKVVKGIRILDKINRVVAVTLFDILQEVQNGELLHFALLYFYGRGHLGEGKSIPIFQEQVRKAPNGYFISWKDLIELSKKIDDLYGIVIIGCFDERLLHRYENDQKMYESCDLVIELIDSNFWEVFSNDESLIDKLALRFKKTEFLATNFQSNT